MITIPLPPDSLFARDYRVVRVLVEDGASTTYVAEQLSTGALRALEILDPPELLDEIAAARFLRDTAPVTSYFESPCVERTLDQGVEAGVPWLATALVEGEPLDAWIARVGAASPRAAMEILLDLGRALQAAHRVGIVHQHLTPRRILVPTPGHGDGRIRVRGFGVARLLWSWNEAAEIGVKVAWISPELIKSAHPSGCAMDVWPLGLLAFYLLTGRGYWKQHAGVVELLNEVMVEPIVPASERARELGVSGWPPELDAWFDCCVSRELEQRFSDAATALVELAELARQLGFVTLAPLARGSSYDDGLEGTSEDPARVAGADGEGLYRQWQRPPRRPIAPEIPRLARREEMIGNPKGSFYDKGLQRRARPRRWLVPALILASAVLAVLGFFLFKR